jgi:hypothetical protein
MSSMVVKRTARARPRVGPRRIGPASLLGAIALAIACSAPQPTGPRFANQPIVWRIDDRADVPVQPVARPFAQKIYFFDAYVYDPVVHALAVPAPRHALDVNAIDEVPDSSWFENRIGRRELSPDEIGQGPNTVPADTSRWTVIQSKTVGGSAGFIALDGRGDRYVIKLDEPHAPVTESATDVAVQRLLWASGYHVPENSVIYFSRDEIALGDKAVVKDEFGNERPMLPRDLEVQLARGYRKADGSYRALASKYLAGKPLGGWSQRGVRPDDPNDTIPHEHRRAVRGLYLFFAWTQQTDVKEDNTLDMWVEDKAKGTHHVKHHLVDFGKSLGMSAWIVPRPGDAHQENVDYEYLVRGLVSFGLWVRPYEGTLTPGIQGVGTFDAEHYDPGKWRPHANYEPLRFLDDRDLFWAGKIIARFTPAQIRAAIEQGRYEDPRAVDYLVDVLRARQLLTIRYAFTRSVAPLDRFALTDRGLCFEDLLIKHRLVPGARATTRFTATATDYAGRPRAFAGEGVSRGTGNTAGAGEVPVAHTRAFAGEGVARGTGNTARGGEVPVAHTRALMIDAFPDDTGAACLAIPSRGRDRDGYTIVRIATRRADRQLGDTEVHLANDPATGKPRIIGLHRHAR